MSGRLKRRRSSRRSIANVSAPNARIVKEQVIGLPVHRCGRLRRDAVINAETRIVSHPRDMGKADAGDCIHTPAEELAKAGIF